MSTLKLYKVKKVGYYVGTDFYFQLVEYRIDNREIWLASRKAIYMCYGVIEIRKNIYTGTLSFNHIFRTDCLSAKKKVMRFDKTTWGRCVMESLNDHP